MLKKIVYVLIVIFLLIVIAVSLMLNGAVIRKAVNTAAPGVLGVPVEVGPVDFRLLRGIVRIDQIKIGNPEGFDTDHLFTMEQLDIRIKMSSLLTDKIIVERVHVIGPVITYEKNLSGSNISKLLEQLSGGEKKEPAETPEKKPEPAPETGKPGKKVIIEDFLLDDGMVKLSLPGMGGTSVPVPLPKVQLKDIGKESEDGTTLVGVIGRVFTAIFAAVGDVVMGSGRLLGEGVKAVGSGAAVVGGVAVDGAAAVGGAAVDGVKAVGSGAATVGGAAVDGAAAVGGAAVKGVTSVGKGLAGLVGLGSDKEKEADQNAEVEEKPAE